jgi:molybdopterin-guanine dinucleotide biosynthesis protein A
MEMVLARFGEPKKKLPQVGEPPITRWVYDKYTVYFEHNSVVNSAVHLGPKSKKKK